MKDSVVPIVPELVQKDTALFPKTDVMNVWLTMCVRNVKTVRLWINAIQTKPVVIPITTAVIRVRKNVAAVPVAIRVRRNVVKKIVMKNVLPDM